MCLMQGENLEAPKTEKRERERKREKENHMKSNTIVGQRSLTWNLVCVCLRLRYVRACAHVVLGAFWCFRYLCFYLSPGVSVRA